MRFGSYLVYIGLFSLCWCWSLGFRQSELSLQPSLWRKFPLSLQVKVSVYREFFTFYKYQFCHFVSDGCMALLIVVRLNLKTLELEKRNMNYNQFHIYTYLYWFSVCNCYPLNDSFLSSSCIPEWGLATEVYTVLILNANCSFRITYVADVQCIDIFTYFIVIYLSKKLFYTRSFAFLPCKSRS